MCQRKALHAVKANPSEAWVKTCEPVNVGYKYLSWLGFDMSPTRTASLLDSISVWFMLLTLKIAIHCRLRRRYAQVITEDVMQWLYTLHLRSPDSTVMLIANQCDGSIGDFSETVETVVKRAQELLKNWQDNRGFPERVNRRPTTLNLLPHASLVSCYDGFGLSDLIDRVSGEGSISISVPPAWDLALTIVDALRDKKAPLSVAREHLNLPSIHRSVGSVPSLYMPKGALNRLWRSILQNLRESGELRSAVQLAAVTNIDSALEGALWIR